MPLTHPWQNAPLDRAEGFAAMAHAEDVSFVVAAEAELASLFEEKHKDLDIDTLIWLHTPPALSVAKMTCDGVSFPSQWLLRYSSKILRQSGFDKFPQLLDNARYQRTTKNMLRSSGHTVGEDIKYVLDLGPSDDFELRSEHLEALTLPKGIIQYSALTRVELGYRVPFRLAGGHDDACQCFAIAQVKRRKELQQKQELKLQELKMRELKMREQDLELQEQKQEQEQLRQLQKLRQWKETLPRPGGSADGDIFDDILEVSAAAAKTSASGASEPTESKPAEPLKPVITSIWELPLEPALNIDDYCEVRHASNVIRLLLFMAEHRSHLLLDSAARVYTICGLAKLFGAGGDSPFQTNLRTQVYDWFYSQANTVIVDVLPEECFSMAWNIQLPAVARVAFRILVAERALRDSGKNSSQPRTYSRRQRSAFGRELIGLDDDTETLLDHASEALMQRVERTLHQIRSQDGFLNIPGLRTYQMLLQLQERLSSEILPRIDEDYTRDALATVQVLISVHAAVLDNPMQDTELSTWAAEKRTDTIMHALEVYVRHDYLPTDFLSRYTELAEPQKHITSTYWYLLHHNISIELTKKMDLLNLGKRVNDVNGALTKAIVQCSCAHGEDGDTTRFLVDTLKSVCGPHVFADPPLNVDGHYVRNYRFVRMNTIRSDMHNAISSLLAKFYDRAYFNPELELSMLDPSPHLMLSLTQNELRFLPLWAGGEDDGTGAVFQEPLPMAQLGPIGPGPAYHTGTTNAAASTAVSTADGLSMVAPSVSNVEDETGDNDDMMSNSSFVVVQKLGGLALQSTPSTSLNSRAVNDGQSVVTDRDSVLTPSNTAMSASDMVMVDTADVQSPVPSRNVASSPNHDHDDQSLQDYADDDFDYEVPEDIDFDDDDDDARSDHTVRADNEEDGREGKDGKGEKEYDMVYKPDDEKTGRKSKGVQL